MQPPSELEAGNHATGKGRVLAWAAWDWGSAAFNAVVTTFVFTVWLISASFVEPGADEAATKVLHNEWLGWGMTAAGVVVALLAPALGALADASGRRKPWLAWNTLVVVACMAGMVLVNPAEGGRDRAVVLGITLLAVGTVFFELASVAYNALLLRITTPAGIGRVSGLGWGLGYVGGIVLLLILFVGFIDPEVGWFGVTSEGGWDIRASVAVATLWMAVFALPVLLWVHERVDEPRRISFAGAYRKLGRDIAGLWRTRRSTLGFLIASAIFRDGLAGVFTFGALLAADTFGFSSSEVIMFAIAANVVAGLFTIAAGWLDDRFGPRRVIVVSLLVLIVAAVGVFVLHDGGKTVFWVAALVLSACVGPVQSASRGLLARVTDPGKETEAYGLYATTGRAASFMAPAAWALAIRWGGAQYWGILGIVVVLAAGLVAFLFVRFPRGFRIDGARDTAPAQAQG
jgi:UMF1 family MFS transporter